MLTTISQKLLKVSESAMCVMCHPYSHCPGKQLFSGYSLRTTCHQRIDIGKLFRKHSLRSRGQKSETKWSEKQEQHWERGEEVKMKEESKNHGMTVQAIEKSVTELFSLVRSQALEAKFYAREGERKPEPLDLV